jgi:hypothetical protein
MEVGTGNSDPKNSYNMRFHILNCDINVTLFWNVMSCTTLHKSVFVYQTERRNLHRITRNIKKGKFVVVQISSYKKGTQGPGE